MAELISNFDKENSILYRSFEGIHSFYLTTLLSIFDVLVTINNPSFIEKFQLLNEQGRGVSKYYQLEYQFTKYIDACNEIFADSRQLDLYFTQKEWVNIFSIGFRCVLSSLSPHNTYKIVSGTSYLPIKTCKSLLNALSAQLSIIFFVTEKGEKQRIDSLNSFYGLFIYLEIYDYYFGSFLYFDPSKHQYDKISSINMTLDTLFNCHSGNDNKIYSIGLKNYSLLNKTSALYSKCYEKFTNQDKNCISCSQSFALSGYDIFCKSNCELCTACRLSSPYNCTSCGRSYKVSEQLVLQEYYESINYNH